jgi:cardiolipin synthase
MMPECHPDDLPHYMPAHGGHLNMLARLVTSVVERPLVPGNHVETLVNGDAAYPAMLDAIRQAKKTISLETYIFDRDEVGLEFAKALGDAVRRGVEVRVLIDAAGTRYSWPSILHTLHREKVKCALFHPSFGLLRLMSVNLRTHRKIMVVDGTLGFTGGLNIRSGHWLSRHPRNPVQDLHFRVRGPVVTQLQEAFAEDWLFATKEALRGEDWFPKVESAGPMLARGVSDGPAMRGVHVDVVLPEWTNLPFVQWASRAMWWQILTHNCRIWLTPPPFDHSKLMIVDGCWVLLGSANWDARSLRLNFEYNVECYDEKLAKTLEELITTKKRNAHEVTLEEMDARSLILRLRDGATRLLTPYL